MTAATVVDKDRLREAILLAREQGYAWVDSELDDSIAGLAVPVRDQDGTIVAAVNVSLTAGTYEEEAAVAEFLQPLRQTASQLRATMVGLALGRCGGSALLPLFGRWGMLLTAIIPERGEPP
ncbi:IclR family transcriptional regulator C-terminal domain-containing protein [Achromobacter denitrificans]